MHRVESWYREVVHANTLSSAVVFRQISTHRTISWTLYSILDGDRFPSLCSGHLKFDSELGNIASSSVDFSRHRRVVLLGESLLLDRSPYLQQNKIWRQRKRQQTSIISSTISNSGQKDI
jgi:hypothetical protein